MAAESSDSDFEPPPSVRRRTASSRILSLSRGLRQSNAESTSGSNTDSVGLGSHSGPGTSSSGGSSISVTARRLNHVVRHGLSVVNNRRFASASVGRELSSIFPFLSQPASSARYASGRSRARANPRKWKTTPCLLNSPSMTRVPTREQMDHLCRKGLGTLWFDKDVDQLHLPLHYDADELHFVLTCIYPSLVDVKYELCRAGGPSHHMIVPLAIDDDEMIPSLDRPFRPYFSVDLLKERIGRKGRLYVRPLTTINLNALPSVSAEHVRMHESRLYQLHMYMFARLMTMAVFIVHKL